MKKNIKKTLLATLAVSCLAIAASGTAFVDASATTNEATIWMKEGAQLKIVKTEEGLTGIRFLTYIDKTYYDGLVSQYGEENVTHGTIIVPTSYVTGAGGSTFEELQAYATSNDLPFGYLPSTGFSNAATASATVPYEYYGSIVSIGEKGYTSDISGIGYIEIKKDDGTTEYIEAEYSDANARNIYEIAKAAYNDRLSASERDTDEEIAKYKNAVDADYSPYTQTNLNNLKGYLDCVADVAIDQTTSIPAMNDTQYYTSPFTVEESGSLQGWLEKKVSYQVSYATEAPVSLLVNDEVQAFTADNGAIAIEGEATVQDQVTGYENVTYNRATASYTEGNDYIDVTLASNAGNWTSANDPIDTYPTDLSYVAFGGENYTVGDMISVDFDGNYLPMLGFYMNGGEYTSMLSTTDGEKTGYLLLNGGRNAAGDKCINGGNTEETRYDNRLTVNGPYRITDIVGNGKDRVYQEQGTSWVSAVMASDKSYRVTVGFVENSEGNVELIGYLFEVTDSGVTLISALQGASARVALTATNAAAVKTYSGKLIVYGAIVGRATNVRFNNTVVKYSEITDASAEQAIKYENGVASWEVAGATGYLVEENGVFSYTTETSKTTGADISLNVYAIFKDKLVKYEHEGAIVVHKANAVDLTAKTVTLQSGGIASKQKTSFAALDNAYIAFKGAYSYNTRVDFYFTGKNMPIVKLFASDINGDMTDGGGSGYLFTNGFYKADGTTSTESNWNARYVVFGPNGMSDNELGAANARVVDCTASKSDSTTYDYKAATLANLDENTNYKYSVFTYENDSSGLLIFKIQLWTVAEDGTETRIYYYEGPGSDGKQVNAADVTAGNIICYAPVKGTGTATFTYVEPYACTDGGEKV